MKVRHLYYPIVSEITEVLPPIEPKGKIILIHQIHDDSTKESQPTVSPRDLYRGQRRLEESPQCDDADPGTSHGSVS